MAWFSQPSAINRLGYTQICVARGTVARKGVGDAAGELQLWYRERSDEYCFYFSKTAGHGWVVCKVYIGVFTLHFQKCSDKTKKSKFHFVQY